MSQSVASEVVSAMLGGMFSASTLYPLEILKTRMQAESKAPKGDGDEGASSPVDDGKGRGVRQRRRWTRRSPSVSL